MRLLAALLALTLPASAIAAPLAGDCPQTTDSTGAFVADVAEVTNASTAESDLFPFHISGLTDEKLQTAIRAYERAKAEGIVTNPMLTIIDYSLSSATKRFWVV